MNRTVLMRMVALSGLVLLPCLAWAAPVTYNFQFDTVAEQNAWTVTVNNDANGPGVPQYGIPDGGSVRIAPIDATTKNTGDIRLYRTITAPAGTTFGNIVFSGLGQGYSSHITWADLLLSADGVTYDVMDRANSGYAEEAIVADASSIAAYSGLTNIYLQIRIVDALGAGSPVTNSPYVRSLVLSAEATPVPEPVSLLSMLGGGLSLFCSRRRK